MSRIATGSFTVTIKPQAEPDAQDGVTPDRMSLDKEFEYTLPDAAGTAA